MAARLKEIYETKVKKSLQEQFDFKNPMQLPRLEKVVINMGVGEAATDKKVIEGAVDNLTAISGQKPVVTKAKKSIAGFKIREQMPLGCKVTLRRDQMFEFLDRLGSIALPRVRDFRGFSLKSFDGNGNLTIGLKEQTIFPEVDYDKVDKVRGMDITIVTSAKTAEEGKALLEGLNLPFKKEGN